MRLKSKILVETKNPKKLFKIFMNTLLGVIVLLLLFKIWMDDFKATDISGLLIPLLIYFQFLGVNKKTDIYAECDADVLALKILGIFSIILIVILGIGYLQGWVVW